MIIEDKKFFKEQLKECLYKRHLMIKENHFWEQFIDNNIIALSFLCLGIFIGIASVYFALKSRMKLDQDLPKGTIIRVYNNDRKWIIVRPTTFMQFLDALILCIFDRGKNKYIDRHDKIRVRAILTASLIVLLLLVATGVILILSALAWSMNPFDYINIP